MQPFAPVFDADVKEANTWIKEINARLHVNDLHAARRVLRAVLHALRDRIGPAHATHLAAQLPLIVRGLYYEAWHANRAATTEQTRAEFLRHVADCMGRGLLVHPATAVDAVLHTMWNNLDPGEVAKLKALLPVEIAALWPTRPDMIDAASEQIESID